MPTCWKPSSRPQSLMAWARAGRSGMAGDIAGNRGGGAYNSARLRPPNDPMDHPRNAFPSALSSAAQVRDLDARLIAAGTSGFELMQRAAHAAWRALRRRWPDAGEVSVLAGRGNNAGDAYLVAALAQRAGWRV